MTLHDPLVVLGPARRVRYRASGRRLRAVWSVLIVAADAVGLLLAFGLGGMGANLANDLLFERDFPPLFAPERFSHFAVLGGAVLVGFHVRGHYLDRLPYWSEVRHIVIACFLAMLVDGFLQFASKADFSRLWLVLTWTVAAISVSVLRYGIKRFLAGRVEWQVRTLIIGGSERATEAAAALASEPTLGHCVVATLEPASMPGAGGSRGWCAVCESLAVDQIVFALSGEEMQVYAAHLAAAARERVPFSIIPPFSGVPILGMGNLHFYSHDIMMMKPVNNLERPLNRALKFTFDFIIANVLVLLVLLPAVLVVGLMIWLEDRGGIIFVSRRIGRDGKPFPCLKFRTMVPDAEAKLNACLEASPAARQEYETTHKLRDDPRVTAVGRFLRKSSLDELPQLLNVLRGDMSLVGPRPALPSEVEQYGKDIVYYYSTRPGMTGPWQVGGRSNITFLRRVNLEIWYVRNWSLWQDFVILLKTVVVVLRRTGAY